MRHWSLIEKVAAIIAGVYSAAFIAAFPHSEEKAPGGVEEWRGSRIGKKERRRTANSGGGACDKLEGRAAARLTGGFVDGGFRGAEGSAFDWA